VVLFKMKRQRYAFVTIVPAAWLAVCTLTAGFEKLFSADAKVGFLAHATRFSDALARGEMLAPAANEGQMRQIVWNDRIDAALAAMFVLVVVSILYYGLRSCLAAYQARGWTANEVPNLQLAPAE
jgi:carbon starvation protein CstA